MLDENLAKLYCVSTSRLNEQVSRNIERFPLDFSFKLTNLEWACLMSQVAISKKKGGRRKLPRVFTEQGVAMLSSVLRSKQAIIVNIEIMRAFIRMRHIITSQNKLSEELIRLKTFFLQHSQKTGQEFCKVWRAIDSLIAANEKGKDPIGFKLDSNARL